MTIEERKYSKKELWNEIKRGIPFRMRHYSAFPAVKIGRLGVHKDYQRGHIGSHLLNMVKDFFLTQNRTGCRFLTVDAYNTQETLKFYIKNHFQFLSTADINNDTRIMYYDLKRYQEQYR